MDSERGHWTSKIGFILAASGSAIGLGNIWRFPYIVGENGGAAFVLIYLAFVAVICMPYMFAEIALGRSVHKNPVGAINAVRPNSLWRLVGILGIITGIGILSFYGVVAGWTVGYIFKMLSADAFGFQEFISNPLIVILLYAFIMLITAMIVYGGISGGIERWSKILMPVLLALMLGLIIYANTLEGSSKGLEFYLMPDFSKVTGKTFLAALGQSFFSLSLGMGLMTTYGSYLRKTDNIISSALYVSLFDTLIAFMSGLIIFPALFSMGENPASGPALVFIIFPKLFLKMPAGLIVGAFFFVLLGIAALTSTISLLEVPVTYFVDEKKSDRKKVVWKLAGITFLVGIPSALSQGSSKFFTNFGLLPAYLTSADFLSHMSFIWGDFSLAFGALMISLFIGWVWKVENASEEILSGYPGFVKIKKIWELMLKYFVPVVIFLILLNLFGLFK